MKAVTWLTNTSYWAGLADTTHAELQDNINYVVGAPSLEMMMDSYNMYYDLEKLGTIPDTKPLDKDTDRVKLFYKYTKGYPGYSVGPCRSGDVIKEYCDSTTNYSVKTDVIDTMYYPGGGSSYWLSSPSERNTHLMMLVSSSGGGNVANLTLDSNHVLCPLVSLKSLAQLELEGLGD